MRIFSHGDSGFCWCFHCRRCFHAVGSSSNLSLLLSSLAEVRGFCLVHARLRGQLEIWAELIHRTWDAPSLAVFFLTSHYLWLSGLCLLAPLERKPRVWFFNWNLSWTTLIRSKPPKWGIHPMLVPSSSFQLLFKICQPLFTSDSWKIFLSRAFSC